MGLEILLTVAIASGGAVSTIYMMLHNLERRLDARLDAIELAIAHKQIDIERVRERIQRLEDNQNQEARNLRNVLAQMQQWIDVVTSPVNVRTDP